MSNSRANTIANSTIFLYIRSFIVLAIGFYTSRVLLKTLGVDDYGLYNLMAGIVAMFTSLRVILASSVQRFMNYEKGKENYERVKLVFNQSILIHIGIAIIFTIIVESFGIWFINNRLAIPNGSLSTALFVFHFSVASSVMSILNTPFDAAVIANEKIKVFAWLTTIDSVLKLAIVYLLPILGCDYLKSYAIMIMLIGVFNLIFNYLYTRRFDECKFTICWDNTLFKELLSFAGWNFLGNTAFALVSEGINMILNMFGGVVLNAARAVAYQIKAAVLTLSNNLIVAAQPYIMQKAASDNKENIFRYTYKMSRLMFLILICTVFPIIIYTDQILDIWLIEVPEMAGIFIQLILLNLVQRALHSPLDTMFKALGDIKNYQIIDSLSLALSLPLGYAAMKIGLPSYSVFVVVCIVEILNLLLITICAKKRCGMDLYGYFKEVIIFCMYSSCIYIILGFLFTKFLQPDSLLQLLLYETIALAIELSVAYVLLPKEEKIFIKSFIKRKF